MLPPGPADMPQVLAACRAVLATRGRDGIVYIGYSGGLDSMVLLHAVAQIAPDRVAAIHVNHGLLADSTSWQAHCQDVCERFSIPIHTCTVDVHQGENLEARARHARYAAFASLMSASDVLLLAHHADDQTETILLHLLQGRGIFGIPRERPLFAGERPLIAGQLVRPLLSLSRQILLDYAKKHDLSWVDDSSNAESSADRNFLRHQILPRLGQRFHALHRRLEHVAQQADAQQSLLINELDLQRNPLPISVIVGRPIAARIVVIRLWLITQGASAGVRDAALGEFATQLDAPADRQPQLKVSGAHIHRYRRQLYRVNTPVELASDYPVLLPGCLQMPHGELEFVPLDEAGSDSGPDFERLGGACLSEPLQVRFLPQFLQEEDDLRILVRGRYRSVRGMLRDAGVPPWLRGRYPLLFDPHGCVLIPDIAVRDRAAIGEGSPESAARYRVSWRELE